MKHRILLLYKKTVYAKYKDQDVFKKKVDGQLLQGQLARLKHAHDEHTTTLKYIKSILQQNDVEFDEFYRGGKIPFGDHDVIVSVGGDGTFLKAAAGATRQLIIGVNSAPATSVGRLCVARRDNFEVLLKRFLQRRHKEMKWQRLTMSLGDEQSFNIMNDVLFAHENPAVLSRYLIKSGQHREEQRSSGVWVSTAIGSTGAIGSAGGRHLKADAKNFQYLPRELYAVFNRKYKLTGGVLGSRQRLSIHSLIPKGKLFIDGGNITLPLAYGQCAEITTSKYPIRTIAP